MENKIKPYFIAARRRGVLSTRRQCLEIYVGHDELCLHKFSSPGPAERATFYTVEHLRLTD